MPLENEAGKPSAVAGAGSNAALNAAFAFWFARYALIDDTGADLPYRNFLAWAHDPAHSSFLSGDSIDPAMILKLQNEYSHGAPDLWTVIKFAQGLAAPEPAESAAAEPAIVPPNPWDPHGAAIAILDAISNL